MHIIVKLNQKSESHQSTAFYEMLHSSGHNVELVFSEDDIKDGNKETTLENLGVDKYLRNLVHGVVFVYADGNRLEL